MKNIVLVLILLLTLSIVLALASCQTPAGTSDGEASDPADSSNTPDSSSAAESSTATTTAPKLSANGIPLNKIVKVSKIPGEMEFKKEALDLMKLIIKDYYNKQNNTVLNEKGEGITLWGVGSFLESITATYKAFPEDQEIKSVYTGLLRFGLRRFKVKYTDNGYSGDKVNGVTPCYYNSSAGNRGDYYYDDDLWIALQLIEAYHLLGDKAYLTQAQEILEFVWLGWGIWEGAEKYDNGGFPWKVGTGPTTCSNAPAAYAFALFSMATDDEALKAEYLERSITSYKWIRKYLMSGQRYKDSFDNDWSGSYNNGVMIAAGSVLYSITGDTSYRTNARSTAQVASTYNMKVENGNYRFNNDLDNPWFSAWLLKGWIEYYKVDSSNRTTYLDQSCMVMQNALKLKLDSGYLPSRIHDANCKEPSTDVVNLGGGVSCLLALAEWAELYGSNYQ